LFLAFAIFGLSLSGPAAPPAAARGLLKDYLKPDVDEYTRKIEVEAGLMNS